MSAAVRRIVTNLIIGAIQKSGLKQSEQVIAKDAQRYWENANQNNFRSNSHWRGDQGLEDEIWFELGKSHLSLLQEHLKAAGRSKPLDRVLEWGCGGGANAVHFARIASEFVGVEVSQDSLVECRKALDEIGYHGFIPVQIDVSDPEKAVDGLEATCDVFLCTYVFELIPSPEYGERLLKIALRLLRPGGIGFIQIKYETLASNTRGRRWSYRRNLANMTTYPIDRFWQLTEDLGFLPKSVVLRPTDRLVKDERYAYFIVEKPK